MMIEVMPGMIPGGISVEDMCAVTGMAHGRARDALTRMIERGIGSEQDGIYHFMEGDRLKAAMILLRQGTDIEAVSEALDWRDFEGMASEMFLSKRFAVMKNVVLTKPRMQIDLVAVRLGVAVLVDCKHWRRYSASAISTAVAKQVERTRHYVARTPGAMAVPVIVTLYHDQMQFVNNVPIVPISKLPSFIDEFYGNLDKMQSIGTG